MDKVKSLTKGGWHPSGNNGKTKESWRGDFKGIDTVAGWVGKKKEPASEAREHRQSTPLSTLKDPASFGPPPKHVNYHGGAAGPNAITPERRGSGAPLSQARTQAEAEAQRQAEIAAEVEEDELEPPPSVPYRADTTGLSTAHLPKPPARRLNEGGPQATSKPKPSLPPRLPPRQNFHPDANAPLPPPTYNAATQDPPVQPARNGYLNQASINRLGQAGVSVPGFNIGPSSNTQSPSHETNRPPLPGPRPSTTASNPQLAELQSRFSKLSSSSPAVAQQSGEGTTWAQKQSALKTANALAANPSSVSLSDARSAASTASNFRERHGTQIAAGWTSANTLNQKYAITDKLQSSSGLEQPQSTSNGNLQNAGSSSNSIKKPPPPPPKKKDFPTSPTSAPLPPPVPLASKPKT